MLAVSVWCVRTLAFPQDVSIAKYHVFGSYVSSSINRTTTTYPILLLILPVHRVSFVRLGSKGSEDYWAIEYTQELADKMVAESAKSGVTYFDTAVRCALLYFPSLSTLQFLPINLFLPLFYLPCYQRHRMHAIARAARPLLRATFSSMLRLVFCHGCRQDGYHVVNK